LAISTPGDIVLDVVRAADPTQVETARARLSSFAAKVGGADFAATLDNGATTAPATKATPEAFRKFEAMVLQTFLQTMLPEDTESVYGGGVAGQMWKSLLAEKLSDSMAERGGIGIADRILSDYYYEGETKVPLQGVSHDPAKPARTQQEMLSLAMVDEFQRKIAEAIDGDRSIQSNPPTSR
jgi:flagellar protein FlgJ